MNTTGKGELVILDGATGSGKSCLLEDLCLLDERFAVVPKLTTRPKRSTDNSWEFDFVDAVAGTSGLLRWDALNYTYAVDTDRVEQSLRERPWAVLVCTDATAISQLRLRFQTKLVYVYRPLSEDQIREIFQSRGSSASDVTSRIQERDGIGDDYRAKLAIVDKVLLNVGTKDQLAEQFLTALAS